MNRTVIKVFRGLMVLGSFAGCAATESGGSGAGRSVFPVRTAATVVKDPQLPEGWRVATALSREQLAATTRFLDAPARSALGRTHRANRMVFVKVAKDASGKWAASEAGDLRAPNVEEVWFDSQEREIGLGAKAHLLCRVVDPAERPTAGYSACTSNFAAPNAPTDGNYWVNVDTYALAEAIKETGLLARFEAERVAIERGRVAARETEEAAALERAKRERAEQAEMEKRRAKERAGLQLAAEHFRQTLSTGAETHCGMIIEVKKPIVKIQTMDGEKWFRAEQVFPPHTAPCRFLNHVYQDP